VKILGVILKQTFWQIVGKVVTSVSTFIILGIIARNYHEAGTGIFTLALTYLAMFNLLADFGFNAHVLKKVTAGPQGGGLQVTEEWNKLLGTRILWSIVLVFLAIATLPFWPFATNDFSKAVVFGGLAIVGSGIFITCNLIFQSKLRYDFSVLASSLGTIMGLVTYIFLSSQGFSISLLLIAYSLSWIIIAICSLLLVKKFLKNIVPIFNYEYAKSLFKDSWPIAATLGLNVVYFRIDSFMIAYFKGISDVGIYNIAYSIFQSVLVLPTFIMNSYYPLMLKSLSHLRLIAIALTGLALITSLLIFVLAPELINVLTKGGFAGAAISLQILSLSFPAFFLSSLFMWLMLTKGQYKRMLIIYTLGLIINLTLNFILIPKYSFYGASWVTVVSEYLVLIMQILVYNLWDETGYIYRWCIKR